MCEENNVESQSTPYLIYHGGCLSTQEETLLLGVSDRLWTGPERTMDPLKRVKQSYVHV
jgi:hypothetical protein